MSTSPDLLTDQTHLKAKIADLLNAAKKKVDAIEITASIERGYAVEVRGGDLDTIEHHQSQSLSIQVYHQQRSGQANTSDFSEKALQATLDKACILSTYTQEDPYAGLADASRMAYHYPDLDLHHPWAISPREAVQLALDCEALTQHPRIKQSEGVSVSNHDHFNIYANSQNFLGTYATSSHSIYCSVIAEDQGSMERDYGYTVSCDPTRLSAIQTVADEAVQKAVSRLGARQLKTRQCPVIFQAAVARSLLGSFVSAIRGSNLYRDQSFLRNQLGQAVFPSTISIYQDPHLPGEIGSAPFDHEGVKTEKIYYVEQGQLQHYALDHYSARKLGMETTGNAGGVYNLFITPSQKSLPDLLKEMDTGLLVTELMGQGVNLITGDYSRGVFGFWVEKGEIVYPVEEITISGNLKDMYQQLRGVGSDIDTRSNIKTGSLFIENMVVAGG